MSNALSVFPAVAAFGLFAALLVLVNYFAVILFFPTAYAVYFKYIKAKWYDHPSRVFRCNTTPWTDDLYVATTEVNEQPKEKGSDNAETSVEYSETRTTTNDEDSSQEGDNRRLVAFFRDRWGPMVIKLRFFIVVFFLVVFGVALYLMSDLQPEKDSTSP